MAETWVPYTWYVSKYLSVSTIKSLYFSKHFHETAIKRYFWPRSTVLGNANQYRVLELQAEITDLGVEKSITINYLFIFIACRHYELQQFYLRRTRTFSVKNGIPTLSAPQPYHSIILSVAILLKCMALTLHYAIDKMQVMCFTEDNYITYRQSLVSPIKLSKISKLN